MAKFEIDMPEIKKASFAVLEPVYKEYNVIGIGKTGETPEFTTTINVAEKLTAPINEEDIVGTIEFYKGEELIAESKLLAGNSVEKEPWYSVLFNIIKTIIFIIIGLIISLIILLYIFNKIRRIKNKNRERIFY